LRIVAAVLAQPSGDRLRLDAFGDYRHVKSMRQLDRTAYDALIGGIADQAAQQLDRGRRILRI
jgi:hypothetical protein